MDKAKFGERRVPNVIVYACYALSFTIILLIAAIVFSINNYIYDLNLKKQGEDMESKVLNSKSEYDGIIEKAYTEAEKILKNADNEKEKLILGAKINSDKMLSEANKKADSMISNANRIVYEADSRLKMLETEYTYQVSKFDIDENFTSEEYKNQYALLAIDEKNLISNDNAVRTTDNAVSKKLLNANKKQILRCFNSETTSVISSVTVKNIESMRSKLLKSFETINTLYKNSGVELTKEFVDIKLKMLNVKYAQEYKKEQEKLTQKAIREQMIEEEKVRKEIEREKAKIEKEENQFKNEIEKIMLRIQAVSDIEKQIYADKIKELEAKLKEVEESKKNVLERESNTRAGYVYVISNIGSFGEDVYKIGMTRRLDPYDRVDELSSASVPFKFDVHAMIFSEDAPALENTLHNIFSDYRVNKVNQKKEFFHVSLDKIKQTVSENFNNTVEWTDIPDAEQYRQSIAM